MVADGGGVIGGGAWPGPSPAPMPELGGVCCGAAAGACEPIPLPDCGVLAGAVGVEDGDVVGVGAVDDGVGAGFCVAGVLAGDDWVGALDGLCVDGACCWVPKGTGAGGGTVETGG